jgi:HSP20 family protein
MDPIRTLRLRWVYGVPNDLMAGLGRLQFSHSSNRAWSPAINVYRCPKCMRICVDLAGVERAEIDLRIEPERLILRGTREVPEPNDAEGRALQLLTMEIDYGPFERAVPLPRDLDLDKAHAEQRNGLLWIHLPFRP